MSASCKPRVQLFAQAGNGWPHTALRYHQLMLISCHLEDFKALLVLSPSHVRNATASAELYLFIFYKTRSRLNDLYDATLCQIHSFGYLAFLPQWAYQFIHSGRWSRSLQYVHTSMPLLCFQSVLPVFKIVLVMFPVSPFCNLSLNIARKLYF